MRGLKEFRGKIEKKYLADIDRAVEDRIRCLDVVENVREWSNQIRREKKTAQKSSEEIETLNRKEVSNGKI